MRQIRWPKAWIAALLLLYPPAVALAQLQTGNLYGTVIDQEESPLPGATVTLSGGGAPQIQVTDAQGRFRYVALPPGSYQLEASLSGYSPVEHSGLIVHVGRSTEVEVLLPPAVSDSITINQESPLLDERRFSTGNTFTLTELERIPTARDPWSVVSSTPGVLLDRINVGGSETGPQAKIIGPGSTPEQVVWALDGMTITDMSAAGSAPGRFDFDSFEEIEVTTGGSDATSSTGGVVINMVTKRGTNDWRASGRFYYADSNLRSALDIPDSELGQAGPWNRNRAQTSFNQGNRIKNLRDVGVEAGGPLVRDHLWAWGSYARPEIDKLTNEDYLDQELLTAWNFKLNGQIRAGNSFTAQVWDDDKIKHGMGAGLLRSPETTQERSDYGAEPTAWKLEDTQILGSSFFATLRYSRVNGGFTLLPAGGEKVPFQDQDLVWHNSYFSYLTDRPQEQIQAEASSYFDARRWSHELKYGAGYRVVEQRSASRLPVGAFELELEPGFGLLLLTRDGAANVDARYTSAFVQDTLTAGPVTLNLGLRYDRQTGRNMPASVAAHPVFPELLPAVQTGGSDAGFVWEDVVPRLGLTWALGKERKTVVRASYSRYADQLGTETIGWTNPLLYLQYRYFYSTNGGGPTLEPDDLLEEIAPPSSGIHPVTLGALTSNAIAPDFEAPLTDELLLGIERELRPDFLVGLRASYRLFTGIVDQELLVFDGDARSLENLGRTGRKHRADDYIDGTPVVVSLPNGQTTTIVPRELRPGVTSRGASLLENGDREQVYKGLFLTLHKRLTRRWMARGHVSWQDWRWRIPDSEIEDATPSLGGGVEDGSEVLHGRNQTVNGTAASKAYVFMSSGWSYAVTGLYRVAPDRPWSFNVGGSVYGREGYPLRYSQRVVRSSLSSPLPFDIPVEAGTGRSKLPDTHVVDLRIEKDIAVRDLGLTLSLDVFNALNESYVLQRQIVIGRTNSDHVLEVLSPRILRLGARFRFR